MFLPCNFYGPVGAKRAKNAYTLSIAWTCRRTRSPVGAQNEDNVKFEKNVYQFGTYFENVYICGVKRTIMVVVSSREFRANQRKYFDLARTNDVVIISRSHGSYRLVPVMDDDTLIDRATLDAKIRQGIADYEAGKVYRMNEGESTEDFLGRMISEN